MNTQNGATLDTREVLTENTEQSKYKGTRNIACSDDVEIYSVNNTPFTVVKENERILIVIGNAIVKSGFNSIEEAIEDAKIVCWDKIMLTVQFFVEKVIEHKKLENNE